MATKIKHTPYEGASEPAVVIVGAGPVGLALANVLAANGHSVLVLERNAGLCPHPRAIACDPEGLRIFGRLGLQDEALARIEQDLRVTYHNGDGRLLMTVDNESRAFGYAPVNTFYQPDIEQMMLDGLGRHTDAEVRFGHEVTDLGMIDGRVRVTAKGPSGGAYVVSPRFIIGADGGTSFVRQAIGVNFTGSTFRQRWLVMDLVEAPPGWRHIKFHCDPKRPTVSVHAPGGRHRFEFVLRPDEDSQALMRPESIRALLEQRGFTSDPRVERTTIYTFHFRVAERFRKGAVILAGDAAHVMPPFAGQGMMSGLRDAMNLGWKLSAVLSGADEALLDTYETERRAHVVRLSKLAVFLGDMIMPTTPWRAWARDTVFTALNETPGLRSLMRRSRSVPPPQLEPSPAWRPRRGSRAGAMVIQPVVRLADGRDLLFDQVLPAGRFTVVGFDVDPRTMLSAADRALCARLGVAWLIVRSVGAPDSRPGEPTEVLDETGAFAAWRGRERVMVLRPDLFVAQGFVRSPAKGGLAWLKAFLPAAAITDGARPTAPEPEPIARIANPLTKAARLAYVVLQRPDLDAARAFFEDFGLTVSQATPDRVRLRGHAGSTFAVEIRRGSTARYLGHALEMEGLADLERLAKLDEASVILANDADIGGHRVELTDPSGFTVHAVAGLKHAIRLPTRAPLASNRAEAPTRLNAGQRPPAGPSQVLRVGHVVVNVVEFRSTLDWYMRVFGLIPTDVLHLDSGAPAVTFLRCDQGQTPTEHHTLVLTSHVETSFGHCAMEVTDLDAIATGGDHLRRRGRSHAWGIGRHLLGSQLFDYWRDPWGAKFEHYADSDMFTADYPTGYHPLDTAGLYQWGPDLPGDFENTRPDLKGLLRMLSAVRDPKSELTLDRIKALQRAMSAPARPWMK